MRRSVHALFVVYVLATAAALVWPVFPWALRRLPERALGLPTPLVWSVGWVAATFVALLAYDRLTRPEADR